MTYKWPLVVFCRAPSLPSSCRLFCSLKLFMMIDSFLGFFFLNCVPGMTKVKVGKEDSSSAEFLEKRRAALER